MIFTRRNCYCNYDEEEESERFNKDFGTDLVSFAECRDWILDEKKRSKFCCQYL